MKEFMLIYKGGDPKWMADASEADRAAVMGKWGAWLGELGEKGHLVTGGSPLTYDGKRLTGDGVVTDIAAAELKELVSGYSIVKAATYEEAVLLAKGCPIFQHKGTLVEIRSIASM